MPRRDQAQERLVDRVLGDETLYPDEFKSFLNRYVAGNVQIRLESFQLPTVQVVNYVGAVGQPAFQNSWVNYGSGNEDVGFYKDPLGRVFLGGLVKSGTSGAVIFTLPASSRPASRQSFIVLTGAADQIGRVDVAANGDVIHVSGATGYVQLNGISFRAA